MLDEKAAEMRRKYLREWRKRNPEKVKEYSQEYWRRKAARAAQKEGADEQENNPIQN